jgi:hypothetical protein
MENIAIAIFCLFYQYHFRLQLAEKDNTTSNFLPCDYSIDVIMSRMSLVYYEECYLYT